MVDGKGGGKPDMAMAGGSDLEKLSDALVEIKKII
jgi:alanyl-tRNA synthetase